MAASEEELSHRVFARDDKVVARKNEKTIQAHWVICRHRHGEGSLLQPLPRGRLPLCLLNLWWVYCDIDLERHQDATGHVQMAQYEVGKVSNLLDTVQIQIPT